MYEQIEESEEKEREGVIWVWEINADNQERRKPEEEKEKTMAEIREWEIIRERKQAVEKAKWEGYK